MLALILISFSPFLLCPSARSAPGLASWYGDEHRGRVMANGERFDPDRLIAASWDYPMGTRLLVSRADGLPMSVLVTITDRGPHRRFVRRGRVIDLSRAAFAKLEGVEMGLVAVTLRAEEQRSTGEKERGRLVSVSPLPLFPSAPFLTQKP
jgi:rare lipoprotein A